MSEKFYLTMAQNGAAAPGNGGRVNTKGMDYAVAHVFGTFVGTVTFEATVDGSHWFSVEGTDVADVTTTATSATAEGAFRFHVAGYQAFRARISAYTSGAVMVAVGVS